VQPAIWHTFHRFTIYLLVLLTVVATDSTNANSGCMEFLADGNRKCFAGARNIHQSPTRQICYGWEIRHFPSTSDFCPVPRQSRQRPSFRFLKFSISFRNSFFKFIRSVCQHPQEGLPQYSKHCFGNVEALSMTCEKLFCSNDSVQGNMPQFLRFMMYCPAALIDGAQSAGIREIGLIMAF